MNKIIIGTHGNLAAELIRSAEMLVGALPDFSAAVLPAGKSREALMAQYRTELGGADVAGDNVIILTDLFGGTPYNAACALAMERAACRIQVFSGVNLAMVLEAAAVKDAGLPPEETAARLVAAGKSGVAQFILSPKSDKEDEL